ncbi:unnamed protein product [Chrysodeixis includens]|uniref:Alpha 1,4-glycosyltransferase domain-containing protein n=1 Tax=Chrysodeixis includens TaxID=689277 RepID=A0A9P0FT88_CHRIL|nr:unnamed protein product [Chrysodeixis includens]
MLYCRITGIFTTILSTLILGLYVIINLNTPCYLLNMGDWLPSAEDPGFAPAERSIFFLETSCAGALSVRQACAVEAAARAHPQRQVYVLFSAPVSHYTLRTSCLAHLARLTNVHFRRLHVAQYPKGTLAETILLEALKQSSFPIEHSSDILRIVTLRKWGGIYLDTNMIVTRSLENLPLNFVAKENAKRIATGILSFGKDASGTNITDAIMFNIQKLFDPKIRSSSGGSILDYVIEEMCPELTASKSYAENPINHCKGVSIFDSQLFYSTYFSKSRETFNSRDSEDFDMERPYTYHMRNHVDMKTDKDTVYETIAKNYCPNIHKVYGGQ